MLFSTWTAAVLLGATCHVAHALNVTILADTNRDGIVDSTDGQDKTTWTRERGALFLANIGDTNQRCKGKLVPPSQDGLVGRCGIPLNPDWEAFNSETYLDQCNDATDNIQRNAEYLAPLLTLPIEGELGPDSTASVYIAEDVAATRSRIFHKTDCGGWEYVDASRVFKVSEFENGLQLGIDARDVRRPGRVGWNGLATVHFTVKLAGESFTDSVALRVAPVLTHHHNQRVERAFTALGAVFSDPQTQLKFSEDFKANAAAAGVEDTMLFPEDVEDVWTQDFFESGYTSIPGPDGPKILRVMIRSAQPQRLAGREVFNLLRSDTVGAVQHHHNGEGGEFDSTGNLEAVPPHTHNGVSYPAGRIIMGASHAQEPDITPFLRAQEEQDPILLDSDWLSVGHVDEFIQFLPYPNERGWVVMALDSAAGLAIIEKAAADGHGNLRAVSRPSTLPAPAIGACSQALEETIDEVLEFNVTAITAYAKERVQYNLDILKREVGITDDDIFYVPDVVISGRTGSWEFSCGGRKRRSQSPRYGASLGSPGSVKGDILRAGAPRPSPRLQYPRPDSVVRTRQQSNETKPCWELWEDFCDRHPEHPECAQPSPGDPTEEEQKFGYLWMLYPSAINSVVLPGARILAANPWGPVINGVDVMTEAVVEAYGKVGYNVTFQDNWASHHVGGGEIHCGSNTWREADTVWWQY